MNKEIAKLKEDTDKMLNSFSINVMKDERVLLEKIEQVFQNGNIEEIKKVVKYAEEYFKRKEKMLRQKGNF